MMSQAIGIKEYSYFYPLDIIQQRQLFQQKILETIGTYQLVASEVTSIPLTNLVVTPLRPQDVGLTGPNWQVSISSTGTAASSANYILGTSGFTVPQNEALVIFGVFDYTPDPLIDEIKITKGQSILFDANIDMFAGLPSTAKFLILNNAYFFKPNDTFNVLAFAHATGTEQFGILGLLFTASGNILT